MFCTKCGNSITEGQKFCTKCGEPVRMREKAPESPAPPENAAGKTGGFLASAGGKVVIILSSALLTAGLLFGVLMALRYGLGLREEKRQESLREQQRTERSESEAEEASSEQPSSETAKSSEDTESKTAATEKASETEQTSGTEEETEPETEDLRALTDEEVLERYTAFLREKLIPEKGIFNPLQVSYGMMADGSVFRFGHTWNPKSGEVETTGTGCEDRDRDFSVYRKEGIVSAGIRDFTGDEIDDLLVVYGPGGIRWNQPFSAELYTLTKDGTKLIGSRELQIPGRTEDWQDPPTEISVVQTESGEIGLLIYYEGLHSDPDIWHEMCILSPAEDFAVLSQFKGRLDYSDEGTPIAVVVTEIGEDLSEKDKTSFDFELKGQDIDLLGRRAMYRCGGIETIEPLLEDHWDGVSDQSGFLEAFLLRPQEEDFSDTGIRMERSTMEYTEPDRYEEMDADISIETVRFFREDNAYSPVLQKINTVISSYTGDHFEYGVAEHSVVFYHYEIGDVIIQDEYISVSGYLTGYMAGGAHGWGSARSWVFSLETGDPMDIRDFTGQTASQLQERIALYYKDSGETQKAVYEFSGLDYTSDVSNWEGAEYAEESQYFRNFCLRSDGWLYLENVGFPPASGGNTFPSRIGQPEEFKLFTGDPNKRAEAQPAESSAPAPEESTGREASEEDPFADSGIAVSDEKTAQSKQYAEYLWANMDSETGKILYGGYCIKAAEGMYYTDVCCFDGKNFTLPEIYLSDQDEPVEFYLYGSDAKEIADRELQGSADSVFSSGGRFLIIWISPYGICAYTHTRAEYGAGTDGLGYMLNEKAITDMCRSIGLDTSLIPESGREN